MRRESQLQPPTPAAAASTAVQIDASLPPQIGPQFVELEGKSMNAAASNGGGGASNGSYVRIRKKSDLTIHLHGLFKPLRPTCRRCNQGWPNLVFGITNMFTVEILVHNLSNWMHNLNVSMHSSFVHYKIGNNASRLELSNAWKKHQEMNDLSLPLPSHLEPPLHSHWHNVGRIAFYISVSGYLSSGKRVGGGPKT